METRFRQISAKADPHITMRVTPGHFATRHSHINYYIDLTDIKCQHQTARLVGRTLAGFFADTVVDTIVCLEGVEVVASFLALALSEGSGRSINAGSNVAIVTPEVNSSGQLMFRDNLQSKIWNRNILLFVASATTGHTIAQAAECIAYYNGKIGGIAAIFSAIQLSAEHKIQSIFTLADVPDYETYAPSDCPSCKNNKKIDALVNSYGYSRL